MEQYLIDTNIVSKYLSGLLPAAGEQLLDSIIDATPALSVITQIELLSWKSGFETQIGEFVGDSIVYALTDEIVKTCITLRRERKIRTPDAIIAATAVVHGMILLTDNEVDFQGISNLQVINPNKF